MQEKSRFSELTLIEAVNLYRHLTHAQFEQQMLYFSLSLENTAESNAKYREQGQRVNHLRDWETFSSNSRRRKSGRGVNQKNSCGAEAMAQISSPESLGKGRIYPIR